MGLIGWLKSKFTPKSEKPLISFVWLLDSPRLLDADTLKRIIEQALEITFPPPSDDAAEFVIGDVPAFMVKLRDHMLLVNCFPIPYMKDAERASKRVSELRIRKILLDHRAWISVDLMGEYEPEALREGWRILGRIAAGLADNRCLGLIVPSRDECLPYDPGLLDQLRSGDPLGALSWSVAPVVSVSGDDSAMKAAVEEARGRWSEFVAAFRSPSPGQEGFSVKLPVTDGKVTEFIWVEVASIEGDVISGDLANEPVDLRFLRLGSRVRGSVADLNDWAYLDNGEMIGGFTSRVLMNQG